jgi:hypothetical protein
MGARSREHSRGVVQRQHPIIARHRRTGWRECLDTLIAENTNLPGRTIARIVPPRPHLFARNNPQVNFEGMAGILIGYTYKNDKPPGSNRDTESGVRERFDEEFDRDLQSDGAECESTRRLRSGLCPFLSDTDVQMQPGGRRSTAGVPPMSSPP